MKSSDTSLTGDSSLRGNTTPIFHRLTAAPKMGLALLAQAALVSSVMALAPGDHLYNTVVNGRNFTLFVPAGVNPLRGVMTDAPGTNNSTITTVQTGTFLQENARLYGYALAGWDQGDRNMSVDDPTQAIINIGNQYGITSLNAQTPRVAFGFSAGGGYSWQEVQAHPERDVFYTVNKGRSSYDAGSLVGSSLDVPGVNVRGTIEPSDYMLAQDMLFQQNRANGALLAEAINEGAKHQTGDVYEHLTLPYLYLVNDLRNPNGALPLAVVDEAGWLADPSTIGNGSMLKVYAWSDYPANLDKYKAEWLLNKNAAYTYAAYSTQNKKVVLTGKDKAAVAMGSKYTYTATVNASLIPNLLRVEFYDYATKIGENAPGNYTFTYTCSTQGVHNIIAIAVVNNADTPMYISNPLTILVKP